MTTTEVGRFRALLASRLGWTFADNDVPQLLQVLTGRADDLGVSPRAYLSRLDAGDRGDEVAELAERLSITETYFFRHGEQVRALSTLVLPERIGARRSQRVLTMLSVGCSSGEEAYTLAIAARQVLPDPGWIVTVLGLDANPAMLRKARAARYSAWSLRETPDGVRERWFQPRDGEYEVHPDIRAAVRFRRHNVADDDPVLWRAGVYDVIFCRNLLMYLTEDARAALVRRMTGALAPGGYLFLGHTDSLGSRPEGLEPQHDDSAFYYRRPDPAAARPSGTRAAATSVVRRTVAPPPPDDGPRERALTLFAGERFAEALAVLAAAQRRGPRDELLYGVLLAQAGRLEDAEIAARRLLDADGLYADAHQLLGVCLEGGAAVDVAMGHYRLAAYLDPDFAMPRLRLGLLARRRGENRTAAPELERALHLLRAEHDERISLFGGGFSRIALAALCRAELEVCATCR